MNEGGPALADLFFRVVPFSEIVFSKMQTPDGISTKT
jgi:hypothetical protein